MIAALVGLKFGIDAEAKGTPPVLSSVKTVFVHHRNQRRLVPLAGSRSDQEYPSRGFRRLIDPCPDPIPECASNVVFPVSQRRYVNDKELVSSRLDSGQASGAVTS